MGLRDKLRKYCVLKSVRDKDTDEEKQKKD